MHLVADSIIPVIFGVLALIVAIFYLLIKSSDKDIEKQEAEIARYADEFNMSLGEAREVFRQRSNAAILGNKCPQCSGVDFYLQPISISQKVVFSSMEYSKNVRVCNYCNVEFVPRVLI
jgi:hypothetical protein